MNSTVQYGIGGGLSREQMDRLHATALRILDEVGVCISNPALLRRLAGQGGVRIDGTLVRFAPEVVNRCLDTHRASLTPAAPPGNDFFIEVLSGYSFQLVDPQTDILRTVNTPDCLRLAAIVDGLYEEGVRGGAPGLPQDTPPALREVLSYKISLEHCRSPGWPAISEAVSGECLIRMAEVAERPVGLSVFVVDPLLVEGPTVDLAVKFLEEKRKVALALSTMPILGVTCPMPLTAAFAEGTATVLGAFTAFMLLGADLGVPPLVFPFDMRTGTMAYGTPEQLLSWLMADQLTAYYNAGRGTWFCPACSTNAIFPDAQSMTSRAAIATVGALRGARHFGFAGWLGIDKIFSAEQLLYDVEVVRYVRHITAAMEFSEATLGFDEVRDVGPGGEFLTQPSTLEHCRKMWQSPLFKNDVPDRWNDGDRSDMKERILALLKRAEERHTFRLEGDKVKELDRLYREAAGKLS